MWDEITVWEQTLAQQPLTERTRGRYSHDARRFAAWMFQHTAHRSITDIHLIDVWTYWHNLQGLQHAATVSRALHSLHLLTVALTAEVQTPFRSVLVWEQLCGHLATALSPAEWHVLQQTALQQRDHGLAHALVQVITATGLRPQELVTLQRVDVRSTGVSARLKLAAVGWLPLDVGAYHALTAYWEASDAFRSAPPDEALPWAFIGQRGPYTERAIRQVLVQVGQQASLTSSLTPSQLHASFLMSVFTPAAYGCSWDATFLRMIDEALHQTNRTPGNTDPSDRHWFIRKVQEAVSRFA